MTSCRYDAVHGHLLLEHWPSCDTIGCPGCLPCSEPHCATRFGKKQERRCTGHLDAAHPRTCARCVSRVLADLTAIENLAALVGAEVRHHGVEHASVNLAGPAAEPHSFEARRISQMRKVDAMELDDEKWAAARERLVPEWDDRHPLGLLGRWDMTLREDYGPRTTLRITVSRARSYLASVIERLAQDDEQDFALFAGEARACRKHLEAVLRDSRRPDRGAPCWRCEPDENGAQPALVLHRGHWCTKDECTKQHGPCEPDCSVDHAHDYGDRWVCPRDKSHTWTDDEYRRGVVSDAKTRAR